MTILISHHMEQRSPKTLMAFLKTGTDGLHREIESSFPLLRPGLTMEKYRDVLIQMYQYYVPLERDFSRFEAAYERTLQLSKRRKVDLLTTDLESLGCKNLQRDVATFSRITTPILTIEDLIGALYVIEGSTLGGQVIQRILKKTLSLSDKHLHYLNSYGSETYPMWHAFREAAEAMIGPSQYPEVLESARSVFMSMKANFERHH